ncbi:dihydrolipoamide dehydrogenase [Salsuginibacillus halophilus]|uniref:Dihydrolipoyl dehydrogenase n=1 Tax=Salsuginibacillus halophilus TaxID=517424 RepID=A0A2P8HY64_9BACI|nr:dihydrolipoyl dehydrogenase [Salsuginibacillus halophilus]PSL51105.1 dihydrolipoamide dehydrogenase [Salsuginibacillus halophilus]
MSEAEELDLVVLGAGTGGYVAAVRAAQLGKKVAVIEEGKLGGTCLHKGCIPSKALLRSAEVYAEAKDGEAFGVETNGVTLNFDKVQARKESVINKLHQGVQYLMKKGNIQVYEGRGRILGPSIFSPSAGAISVERSDGEENDILIPKQVLIATGSKPNVLPGLKPDGERVFTSDEALDMEALPASMVIIGGGVIGIEWASMLVDFDVEVTVIEAAPRILPFDDPDVSKEMKSRLEKRGVTFYEGAAVDAEKVTTAESVTVPFTQNEQDMQVEAEAVLQSVGRRANIKDIGLENTDIETDRGVIVVNEFGQTKESHMYAIGDVVGGLQLAHAASHEGITAVEHMFNENPDPNDESLIPRCTYSRPEAASIGLNEEEAEAHGYSVKTGKFSFQAVGKALVHGDAEGFCKVIINEANDDLLGVHIVGAKATELISEAALAKLLDASGLELASTIHPHPTLSEVIGEAALAVDGRQIHS